MVGTGHCLHCQIAYVLKVLPIEQIRAVSQFPLCMYMCVGGSYLDSPLLEEGIVICFCIQHLVVL